ncbi:hypothetical protein BC834DRAFT_968176 [Gloeopeniophorella convolvens]|nr:hypothetical protein BC834DRAFT_968176 [Gloeopeniophorella convolvens]
MHHTFGAAIRRARLLSLSHKALIRSPASIPRRLDVSARFLSTKPSENSISGGESTRAPPLKTSSVTSLPAPPRAQKFKPPIITTPDIKTYIEPLYERGWALAPILPAGHGLAVLRKRFELPSSEALHEFLADLKDYEATNNHHAKTQADELDRAVLVSTWTHVARRPGAAAAPPRAGAGAVAAASDEKVQGVTARDIRLAYELEKMFERALAASGTEYRAQLRPEAERPRTVEELVGYS